MLTYTMTSELGYNDLHYIAGLYATEGKGDIP